MESGYIREDNHENYYYDKKQDIFICDKSK